MSWWNDVTNFVGATLDKGIQGVSAYYDARIAYNQRETDLATAEKMRNDARQSSSYGQGGAYDSANVTQPAAPEYGLLGVGQAQTALIVGAALLAVYAIAKR